MAWAPGSAPGGAPVTDQPMYPPGQGYPYPPPPNQGYGQPPAPGYAPPAPGYAPPPPQGYAPPPQGYAPPAANFPVNVPPGLDSLLHMDQLIVKQKVEWVEALLGCETKNKYKVLMPNGQELFDAVEENDCCTRNFCGPQRPFDLEIKDPQGNELIHLYRPLRCSSCWFPCFLQEMEVYSPPGNLIGSIQQEWSLLSPKYSILDAQGQVALTIEGPICTYSICGDVEFEILSPDGSTNVGKISKQWSGLLKEAFTDADIFGINFPMDLDVRMKAVCLAACFLIDFMYFEKTNNSEGDRPGMLDG